MHILAALAIIVILLGVRWVVRKYLPDRPCWWCKGTGKRWGSNRKRSGPCFFCGGSGKRKRKQKSR